METINLDDLPCPSWCEKDNRPHDSFATDSKGRVYRTHDRSVLREAEHGISMWVAVEEEVVMIDNTLTLRTVNEQIVIEAVDSLAMTVEESKRLSDALDEARRILHRS